MTRSPKVCTNRMNPALVRGAAECIIEFGLAETFPGVRNMHAHGSESIYPSVLGTFEIAADLIHQLFPATDAPDRSAHARDENVT